jgi:hypothetical protein
LGRSGGVGKCVCIIQERKSRIRDCSGRRELNCFYVHRKISAGGKIGLKDLIPALFSYLLNKRASRFVPKVSDEISSGVGVKGTGRRIFGQVLPGNNG